MKGLCYCRRAAGLSQQRLADLLGVTRESVANWETGVCWPPSSRLPAIAQALGCCIDDLFCEPPAEAAG